MFQEQRLNKLLQLLEKNEELSSKDMIDYFKVSRDTIRRDFLILTKEGKVKRTHGGIMKVSQKPQIYSFEERLSKFSDAKTHIAKNAETFIKDNGTYFLDVSTTVLKLAQLIDKKATIYSHSLDNAIMLSNKQNIKFNLLGGQFFKKNRFYYSLNEAEVLKNISFDVAFIGAAGLRNGEISFEDQEDAFLKQLVLQNAKTKILVAEETKFNQSATYTIGTINDFDYFITDKALKREKAKLLSNDVSLIYREKKG
ncbi:TPA: DeoR/GlpR family DNA-binding transcription regulator [Enterococcus faecium]